MAHNDDMMREAVAKLVHAVERSAERTGQTLSSDEKLLSPLAAYLYGNVADKAEKPVVRRKITA